MREEILIKKVETIEDCKVCNTMLEELIKFESNFDDEINSDRRFEEFYERTLGKSDSVIFVAVCEQKTVGYIMAYKQKENLAMNSNIVTIMNLFIRTDYRGKKIGTHLLSEVEQWAKQTYDHFVLELDCIASNFKAIEVYKHLGYKPVRIKMRKKVS